MLTVLLSSPRVAPGLLSWQAWSALRAAARVLAPSGHPLIPALTAAGVAPVVVDAPPSADSVTFAAFLSADVSSSGGSVVWLAPQGSAADPLLLGSLSVPYQVIDGSHDLPGAHLLDLASIMDTLRVSCPWDREQTHQSLLPYLLEEAYEAAETIETGDLAALREEIGDVMFQAFFHARIAAERPLADGGFTIDDVADTLAAKLVRRHPHVFGSVSVSSAADVNANWEEIKKAERAAKARTASPAGPAASAGEPSVLDGVSFGQPALSLAAQLQRRAERAGIAVPADGAGTDAADLTGERLGAALMTLVARAREAGLDPELELRAAARCFADWVRKRERAPEPTDGARLGRWRAGPAEIPGQELMASAYSRAVTVCRAVRAVVVQLTIFRSTTGRALPCATLALRHPQVAGDLTDLVTEGEPARGPQPQPLPPLLLLGGRIPAALCIPRALVIRL